MKVIFVPVNSSCTNDSSRVFGQKVEVPGNQNGDGLDGGGYLDRWCLQGADIALSQQPLPGTKSDPWWMQLLPAHVNREQVLGDQVPLHHVVKYGY